MAITSGILKTFKAQVMLAEHDLNTNTLKIGLVSSGASCSPSTGPFTYTSLVSNGGELANGNGYSTGGTTLADVTVTNEGTSGVVDFSNVTLTDATFTARGAFIYNDSHSTKSMIAYYDFGADKSASAGNFVMTIPSATSAAAIIRLN